MKKRVGIIGINGRMGKELIKALDDHPLFTLAAGYDIIPPREDALTDFSKDLFSPTLEDLIEKSDLIIDFSSPKSLKETLPLAIEKKKKLLIGTTGLSDEFFLSIEKAAKSIPIFYSANFSIGIAITKNLVSYVTKSFPHITSVNIIDMHHTKKKDAPSGTAIMLKENIQGQYEKTLSDSDGKIKELPLEISSIREGDIVGIHEISFHTEEEEIRIRHEAKKRSCLAKGAVIAAEFLSHNDRGLFCMEDLLVTKL